ncbi:ABC transporter permease [Puia sp.]|uniref:ABC transporter permease n=1 Tax=Puia sp. TaxID=2045100 RepID=UPI002F42EF2C
MFTNYFKSAWRNILRGKGFTLFNILGLSTGMAVALIIGLWVSYQLSYDRFLPQYEQAQRIMVRSANNGETNAGFSTSLPVASVLKKDIPGIRYVAQADWFGMHGLVAGDKKLYSKGGFAGEEFLKIFQYPLLQGNAGEVLKEPASIVLTRATAIALFGNQDPMNKTVRLDNLQDLKVSGVLADLPGNSSLQFDYLIPFSFYIQTQGWIRDNLNNWNLDPIQTFVALQPGITSAQIQPRLNEIVKKYNPDGYQQSKLQLFTQSLKNWHLYADFKNGAEAGGFIDYVRIFSIVGLLVLLIACINFTNLSTVRAERRAKEVGVRKAIGSLRSHIIIQFLTESLLIAFFAFAVALVFVYASLPAFNALTACTVSIPWHNAPFWGMMLAYILFTGLLAGSRPAFYLSSFRPVKVLKSSVQISKASALPGKILVVMQFTCSVALIISTVIVYQQIQYAKSRPTGFKADRLVITDANTDIDHHYTALKSDLLKTGVVSSVTKATTPATNLYSWTGVDDWQGKNPGETLGVATVGITEDYFQTLGMQLAKGRDFTGGNEYDSVDVILNEAAVRRMRFKEPINQVIHWNNQKKIRVIGVVRDALMMSPFSPAEPTFFVYNPIWSSSVMYRLSPNADAPTAMAKISTLFSKYNPTYPFLYHFADENYAAKFSQELLIGKLSGIFAALAIFISCLGLFGLTAYVAQQRTKEIGIRKVLGASVLQVLLLLSKDFIVLVVISCLIASPVAYYFLHSWLLGYYYRIEIGPGVFVISTLAAIMITIGTVSFQAAKAALMNPVKSLRTDG